MLLTISLWNLSHSSNNSGSGIRFSLSCFLFHIPSLVCVCMCVFPHMCTCVHMCACIFTNVCMCIHTCMCTCVHVLSCMWTCVHMCMCVLVCVLFSCMCTYMCAHCKSVHMCSFNRRKLSLKRVWRTLCKWSKACRERQTLHILAEIWKPRQSSSQRWQWGYGSWAQEGEITVGGFAASNRRSNCIGADRWENPIASVFHCVCYTA